MLFVYVVNLPLRVQRSQAKNARERYTELAHMANTQINQLQIQIQAEVQLQLEIHGKDTARQLDTILSSSNR